MYLSYHCIMFEANSQSAYQIVNPTTEHVLPPSDDRGRKILRYRHKRARLKTFTFHLYRFNQRQRLIITNPTCIGYSIRFDSQRLDYGRAAELDLNIFRAKAEQKYDTDKFPFL